VLNDTPVDLLNTDEDLASLAAEKQRLYLTWQQSLPAAQPPNKLYFKARREFAQVTSTLPHHPAAYRHEAVFWNHMGHPEMARRALTSILHVTTDPECRHFLEGIPQTPGLSSPIDDAPVWSGSRRAPRVLVITHDRSDYGLDTLYDGLVREIGGDNIEEFPWKPMLHGQDPDAVHIPLPFGYPDARVPLQDPARRDQDVFWAGKRVWGMRPLFLPEVERVLGVQFQENYSQVEYSRRLRGAAIGLSLCGTGFDTVRYWEVPAHGVMLLAERPPLCIPGDFVDGRSAVFFGDLPELLDKLQHYRAHPEEAERIAEAGYRHFLAHHTT
jgi:hypothetical protein